LSCQLDKSGIVENIFKRGKWRAHR
jgi:hypothetical protein